jgi:hypothetical protein
MKTRMKLTGMAELRVELRQLAVRVPDGARKVMHRSAEIIVEEAKLNAPRDWGNLEDAIRIIKDYTGVNGRLQIDIGIVPTGSEMGENGPISVDRFNIYAALVHENYETHVAYVKGPGKGTLAKMAANPGRKIGSGFLSRAAAEEEPRLARKTIAAIDRTIKEVM